MESAKKDLISTPTPKQQKENAVRIYTQGVFDLFSLPEIEFLKACKHQKPNSELVVGVLSNADVPCSTVQTEDERVSALSKLSDIHQVIFPCPLAPHLQFLTDNKIDYVVQRQNQTPFQGIEEKLIKLPAPAGDNLIAKVLKEYEFFVEQLLEEGHQRQDLKVSLYRSLKIGTRKKLKKLKRMLNEMNHQVNKVRLEPEQAVQAKKNITLSTDKWLKKFNAFFTKKGKKVENFLSGALMFKNDD